MKPYQTREYHVTLDHQLSSKIVAGVRFARKTLVNSIDDIGVLDKEDNEVYLIGNAGAGLTRDTTSVYGAKTPNGKEFLTASEDGTLLVWDLAEVLKRGRVVPPVTPPVRPMDALWDDLASDDAALAERAVREVARSPGAERFLSRHLKAVAAIPPTALEGILADLDSDRAAIRDSAEARLAALGEQATSALQRAEKAGSAEVRRRAKRLLARGDVFVRTGPQARPSRAIEALEMRGTPAARKLLAVLARGADTSQTREAKSALSRLRTRVSSEP